VAGRKIENEDLVNRPNWLPLSCPREAGEWFEIDQFEMLEYEIAFSLRESKP